MTKNAGLSKVKSAQKAKAMGKKAKESTKQKILLNKRNGAKRLSKSPKKSITPMKKVPSPVKAASPISIPPPYQAQQIMPSFRMASPSKAIKVVRSASKSPKKMVLLSPKKTVVSAKEVTNGVEPSKKRWYFLWLA